MTQITESFNSPAEQARLKALKSYEILDTPTDGNFDRITALASKIFNIPIAIISLVDHDRIWFKSHHGLDVGQIDREPGLCASAILSDEVYVVENALEDPRTLANPLVAGEFGLRFYAAAPLHTASGHNLGTLCIIDQKQRYLTEQQKTILHDLASIAMDEMEIRLAARTHTKKINLLLGDTAKTLQQTISGLNSLPDSCKNASLTEVVRTSQESLQQIEKLLVNQL